MRWASGIIVALGLSFVAVLPSVGQDTAPGVQALPQDTAKRHAPEADKDAGSAAKGESAADAKSEGKGVSEQKNEDKAERKTEGQPGESQGANSDNPDSKSGGQAESKTSESKAEPKIEDKAEAGAKTESNAKPDKESHAGGGSSTVPGTRIANTDGAGVGAATSSVAGANEAHRLSNPPPVPTAVPPKKPRKVVVREGGADEPAVQILTGMAVEEASSERRETEKFLDAADENLKRVAGRTLDAQQQETISQIHNYVERARSALKEGDVSRGHTLALKANLLADDLVKH